MPTPSIQTLTTDAQQVLNLDSISAVRSVVAVALANANTGTPLNPNLTTQQLWDQFYQVVTKPKSDIESIIANQLMKLLYAPPAPGGAGADKQVIFNDGGVLAGDADFLWNKTTNLLTVTGAATITGDLTVRTNKLAVTSTGVGAGTASPLSVFTVQSQASARLSVRTTDAVFGTITGGTAFDSLNGSDASLVPFGVRGSTVTLGSSAGIGFQIDASGNATWSNVGGVAGTAMILNSTGLGIGVGPSYPFHLRNSAAAIGMIHSTNANGPYVIFQNSTANFGDIGSETAITGGGSAGNLTLNSRSTSNLCFAVNDTVRMRIDSSGNVGIGVTPNTWTSTFKAIQHPAFTLSSYSTTEAYFSQNAYYDGGWKRVAAGYASQYLAVNSEHRFLTAGTSTAGSAITFTQAMTLDASGNLLVGKTATNLQVVGCELKANGTVFSTLVDTTNAAASSYQLYSTGAATYRFYVGMGGTVFATNTTISGISDARLKENVQDIDVGLGAILALKPRKFDWKAGKGKDIKGDRGFIAQEFEEVFPNLIDEWKDEAPEGEAPYKSVRQDLIPVLVKAIQELAARVQTLETR